MDHTSDIVILGLGETGVSCVQYYAKKNIPVVVLDSREAPPKLLAFQQRYPNVPVYTGGFPHDIIASAKKIIISPGISIEHPDLKSALSKDTEILGDIELFAREVKVPVVGITGSNGKSTVTTLLGEMAKEAGIRVGVGGNIGTPALSLLFGNFELIILELSSFQLETTSHLKLKAATILNISPDHMDRYSSLLAYKLAKLRIYQQSEYWVVNREDPILPAVEDPLTKIMTFGLDRPRENAYGIIKRDKIWLARGTEALIPISDLPLFGKHNLANALAALALGESVGLPLQAMLSALQKFSGLSHRCEWVREFQGVQWINDSKGTNVGASVAALQGLVTEISGKWVLIAGGVGKNADFSPLLPLIKQYCLAVVLIGEAAKELQALLQDIVPCVLASDMPNAVHAAWKLAKAGDGVLLSPACASLDMFRDFEERGDVFKESVQALKL